MKREWKSTETTNSPWHLCTHPRGPSTHVQSHSYAQGGSWGPPHSHTRGMFTREQRCHPQPQAFCSGSGFGDLKMPPPLSWATGKAVKILGGGGVLAPPSPRQGGSSPSPRIPRNPQRALRRAPTHFILLNSRSHPCGRACIRPILWMAKLRFQEVKLLAGSKAGRRGSSTPKVAPET